MINKIKKAILLKEQGKTIEDIAVDVEIARAYIPKLIQLYIEMESEKLSSRDIITDDQVLISKSKYILSSIKRQKKFMYARYLLQLEKEKINDKILRLRIYLEKKESYDDLEEELWQKQKMLNVTSSNLQHAEDHYELMEKNLDFTRAYWFMFGMLVVMFFDIIMAKFF